MTNVINAAHEKRTRVVLTVQSFGWTCRPARPPEGASSAARRPARTWPGRSPPRCATAAPTGSTSTSSRSHPGYEDEFIVARPRRIRTELEQRPLGLPADVRHDGLHRQLPDRARDRLRGRRRDLHHGLRLPDRDRRTRSDRSRPLVADRLRHPRDGRGPTRARVPASKLILGVPYYGRAWSTRQRRLPRDEHQRHEVRRLDHGRLQRRRSTISRSNGRRYDATEGVAWTAYRRENCTSTYGCVTPWRQLYVDDAQALRAKYDLVNSNDLRGAGIWALGYDGTRTELWKAIGDKFAPDVKPSEGRDQERRTGSSPTPRSRSRGPGPMRAASPATTCRSRSTAAAGTRGCRRRRAVRRSTRRWTAAATRSACVPAIRAGTRAHGPRRRSGSRRRSSRAAASGASWPTACRCARARRRRPRRSATLNSGDIVAITGGPTSSGGYVWHRVTGPIQRVGDRGQRPARRVDRDEEGHDEIRHGGSGTEHRDGPRRHRHARHRRSGDRRDREHRPPGWPPVRSRPTATATRTRSASAG